MISDDYISHLPESPGVYLFKDEAKEILYVGKARSLRDRVRSYFRKGKKDGKTERLLRHVDDVSIVLTGNEKEAFLLENNLIKEHQPKYNIILKDDKTYVSLRLSIKDRFPALTVTRTIKDDGALYFGPHPYAKDARELLKVVQSVYPMRRCRDSVFDRRTRPCMLSELEKCPAPCVGRIDEAAYRAIVCEVADFLQGKNETLLKRLEARIEEAAKSWNFEEAQAGKEKYDAVRRLVEKQHVHEHMGIDRDAWGFLAEEGRLRLVVLTFRRGVLISKRTFKESFAPALDESLASFLFQYYSTRPIPDEIVLSEEIEDRPLLQQYLREKKKARVRIHGPLDAGCADVIRLAVENLHEVETTVLDEAFKKVLHLTRPPKRIEIYDISHTHGQNPSGIMVVFEDFKPKKEGYRVFHIREAASEDDVAMMAEVLRRRIGDERMRPLPDLVIVDGGKAQLAAATTLFRGMVPPVDAMGIAKGERRRRMEDILYLPLRKNPLLLPKSSPVFKEVVRMRDEAHRFAITSHKKWKRREDLVSELEGIKGVGKKRAMVLLKTFPSIEEIKRAGAENIARIKGFNRSVAEEIMRAMEE
ncbi:MAG: excinuclease ABC subunit UvrC [Syntrophorhabdales bacterium]